MEDASAQQSSLECDAKKFGNAVRSHWGIKNI